MVTKTIKITNLQMCDFGPTEFYLDVIIHTSRIIYTDIAANYIIRKHDKK